MSWYANTVLPTMEDVFADVEPPKDAMSAAMSLSLAGYPDVSDFVKKLSSVDYATCIFDAHLKAVEVDRPQAFADESDSVSDEEYEAAYACK